jgi:hypothetical protein
VAHRRAVPEFLPFSARYLLLDIRPELGKYVFDQIEPEPGGATDKSMAHGMEPVWIPLFRNKGSAVCAS